MLSVPTISFTTFLDFQTATPAQRLQQVLDAREQYANGYDFVADYYKRLREGITVIEPSGFSAVLLQEIVSVASEKKQPNFAACASGRVG